MEPDLLKRLAAPGREPLVGWLAPYLPVSQPVVALLVDLAGLALLAALLAQLAPRVGAAIDTAGARLRRAALAATGLGAAALFGWVVRHPTPTLDGLFGRWDHLVMAALVGIAATRVPSAWSKAVLTAISGTVLVQYCGWQAVGLVAGAGLVGFALFGSRAPRPAWQRLLPHLLLLAACYGVALRVREQSLLRGLGIQGVLAFVGLRHLSAAVAAQTARVTLVDYAAYMSFYPGLLGTFGGPEVYSEFARRNLARRMPVAYARAARRVRDAVVQVGLVALLPLSADGILSVDGVLAAWAYAIAFFVRSALWVMGCWAMIDAVALFYGVRLHTNFGRLLVCQNPSELWRSWRGSFTNWLIIHVYAPLGASRRHPSLNILAAFGVSLLWHALGVPFLHADFQLVHLLPVTLWAALNAAAVLAHVNRERLPLPSLGLRPVNVFLTWVLGAATPLLLYFQGEHFRDFPALLAVLFGVDQVPGRSAGPPG